MKVKLLFKFTLALAAILYPVSQAQCSNRAIEIQEQEGLLHVSIPLLSYQKGDQGSMTVIGQGQLGNSAQQIRLQFGPNQAAPRKGVTHTDKSCLVSIDEELFLALAKHLSVSLPASPIKLKPRSFDLLETQGSLELAATAPVNLELLDLVDEEMYSEWYLTIDVQKKSITLSEKNPEYRQPFFNAFTG